MPRKKPTVQNKEMQARIAAKFGKSSSRTGGRGSVRRKFKAPPKSSMQDDKRLQGQLKKLNVNPIPAIEEVNLFKDDGTVVHFTKPKVQAEISSNTYVISGQCETKKLEELIPQILPQLGREHIDSLKNFANAFASGMPDAGDDDDVPVLVDDNFEAVASSDQNNEKTDDAADADAAANTNANADTTATDANNDNTDNNDANADATAATDAAATDKTENTDNNNDTTEKPDATATDAAADNGGDAPTTELKPDADAEVSV